jgi:hypothetical protein
MRIEGRSERVAGYDTTGQNTCGFPKLFRKAQPLASSVSGPLGQDPAAGMRSRAFNSIVIASEAKRSILPLAALWIASSRSLSSGARSRDPLAPRNDELQLPWNAKNPFPSRFKTHYGARPIRARSPKDRSIKSKA